MWGKKGISEEEKREVLTDDESIELKRQGTSDMLRVPAFWRKSFRELKGSSLIFEAHLERDQNGGIYIVFRKIPDIEARKRR
jgi:hypothetical protein